MGYEVDTEERIRRWRAGHTAPGDPVGDVERGLEDLTEFAPPSGKRPVDRARLLAQLDLGFLDVLLARFYEKSPHYPAQAMLRGVLYGKGAKLGWRPLVRHLKAHPEKAKLLGFVNEDDEVEIPSREQFRTFAGERLDWDRVRDAIVGELRLKLRTHGIELAAEVAEDATMVETVAGDPDAAYNGHYEKTGLKADLVTCRATGLPVANETIGGTRSEGPCLPRQVSRLRAIGCSVRDVWVDGTYATFENIAVTQVQQRLTLHYQVQDHWTLRDDGEPERIKNLYQQFRSEPDFRAGAALDEMLAYLVRRAESLVSSGTRRQQEALANGAWGEGKRPKAGRPSDLARTAQAAFFDAKSVVTRGDRVYEAVGAHFRNKVMRAAASDPAAAARDKGKRQIAESINDHLKNDLGLQWTLRVKGIPRVHRHITTGVVFLLSVALVKVQNGVTSGLASLVGVE